MRIYPHKLRLQPWSFPGSTWRQNDVSLTSTRLLHVVSTLPRRHFAIMCPLSNGWWVNDELRFYIKMCLRLNMFYHDERTTDLQSHDIRRSRSSMTPTAQWFKRWPLDLAVPSWSPAWGGDLFIGKRGSIAHSLIITRPSSWYNWNTIVKLQAILPSIRRADRCTGLRVVWFLYIYFKTLRWWG